MGDSIKAREMNSVDALSEFMEDVILATDLDNDTRDDDELLNDHSLGKRIRISRFLW
jgi:hypothetical protein